jgi:trichohyalin
VEYFDYGESEAFEGVSDFDVEEFLEESQKREQELLEQELERIDDLLEERERIHEDAVTELESKLDWYIERLEDLNRRGLNRDKDDLKQRIEEFYNELREQERKHWLDRQELEKERRELEKELQEFDLTTLLENF